MQLNRIFAVLFLIAAAGCAPLASQSPVVPAAAAVTQPATRPSFVSARAIIIIRHADIDLAEKASMGNAAPLTPRGQERAKELAYSLKDAGITRIITTEALRTRQTATVLAKELNLESEILPRSDAETLVNHLAKIARPVDVILIVHHHSTLPSIFTRFGYPREPHYDDATEFDRMYVILPDADKGMYRVVRTRFRGVGAGH